MDISRVTGFVKNRIPQATEMDCRARGLDGILERVNAVGIAGIRNVTVTHATGTYDADPFNRTNDQTFNYYPLLNALVMPTGIKSISSVWNGTTRLEKTSKDNYLSGTMPVNSYVAEPNGIIYFSGTIEDATVLKIDGVFAGFTIDNLPDSYEPWIEAYIIMALSLNQYKNKDLLSEYIRKEKTLWWQVARGVSTSSYAGYVKR